MTKILPEIYHRFNHLPITKITKAYENGDTITGLAESISCDSEHVIVRLGKNIQAVMPFSEATIYPLRYSTKHPESKVPSNIHSLLKHKIRVKVLSVAGEHIVVSRKQNMLEAYSLIPSCEQLSMYVTEVIPKTVFGDIGEGITGKIYIKDVCAAYIKDVSEYFAKTDNVPVVFRGFDAQDVASVSYREAFKPYSKDDYKIGMTVNARIHELHNVSECCSSYYASVTPQVSGIININGSKCLEYGSKVECIVTGISDKGLHLDFSKLL